MDARLFAVTYACACAIAFRLTVPYYVHSCDHACEPMSCEFVRKMLMFYKTSPLLVAGAVFGR